MQEKKQPITEFSGTWECLSNFYSPACVCFEERFYKTAEHAYQAAKTIDDEERIWVAAAGTPAEAKRRGKKVTKRPEWNSIKYAVMFNIIYDKFRGSTPLREKLLATGDRELIEGNWWGDTYWGVCRGEGQNNLGKILMQVREDLRDDKYM